MTLQEPPIGRPGPDRSPFHHYSIAVDSAIVDEDEYFCTFLPRIHRDAYLADSGSLQCQIDFLGSSEDARAAATYNEERGRTSYAVGCINPVAGNFTALCACEAIPDRLALTTYMVEYAYIHDDVIEYAKDKEESQLWKANQELIEGLDLDSAARSGSKDHVRRRQLQAKMAVEMMDIDPEAGKTCLKLWKEMSDVFVEIRDLEFKTLAEYLPFRVVDAGCPWTMSLLCFSMDFKLTAEETETTAGVTAAAYDAWVLVNDYFSWKKEWKNFQDNGAQGQIVSAVFLIMRWRSVEWPTAKSVLREEIKAYEQQYVKAKDALRARGECTPRIEKWLELLDLVTAGNFAWSMTTARYDDARPDSYPELRASRQADWHASSLDVLSVPISIRASKKPEPDIQALSIALPDSDGDEVLEDGNLPSLKTTTTATTSSDGDAESVFSPRSPTTRTPSTQDSEKSVDLSKVTDTCFEAYEEAYTNIALAPYHYVESMPSKGIRSSAIDGLEAWYQVPEQSLSAIRYIINTLHGASLMIDDIQDESTKRRGFAATHMVYGIAQTINSANLLMFKAVEAAQNLSVAASQALVRRVVEGHIGQGMDLHWTRQTEIPSEMEYFAMVDRKTGGLFTLLAELMRSEATQNKDLDLTSAMTLFGRFFQARDDYQNIKDAQYEKEKGFADDINEGKISLPMVYAMGTDPSQRASRCRLVNIFQQRKFGNGLSQEVRELAVKAIQACGAFEKTKSTVLRLQKEVDEALMTAEQYTGSKNWLFRLIQKRLEI